MHNPPHLSTQFVWCAIMPLSAQFVRNLKRFRLVTFDVTDTLLQLNDPIAQYVNTAASCGVPGLDKQKMGSCFKQQFKMMSKTHANYGRNSADMDWQRWWLQLVTKTFACVDASIPESKVNTIAEQLLEQFRTKTCWTNVPCAAELVQSIREADKCVGVISNFDPSLIKVLEVMGFGGKFDFILTSYEAGVMKPDPGIFAIPVQELNISPHQALHIGNKIDMDYMGARNSGWSSLLVHNQSDFHPADCGAVEHSFDSLADMLQALQTRNISW